MIYQATKAIQKYFDENGINARVAEYEEGSCVETTFNLDDGPVCLIRFISGNGNNDVAIRSYRLVKVWRDKRSEVMRLLNDFNARHRYIKMVMDDMGDVSAEYDLCLATKNMGPVAREILIRWMALINMVYPEIERLIR